MLSVGWQYLQSCSLVVWPLGPSCRLCMLGTMGMLCLKLRVRWVCWVYWGDCRGSLWAVGWPLWAVCSVLGNGYVPGHPQGETSLRVCRVRSGYEKFHKTLNLLIVDSFWSFDSSKISHFQGITEVGDCLLDVVTLYTQITLGHCPVDRNTF